MLRRGEGGGILGKFRYSQNRGALSSQLRGKLVIESVLRNPEEAVHLNTNDDSFFLIVIVKTYDNIR